MLLGHDSASEVAVFSEERVLVSPHLVTDGDLGADELTGVPAEPFFTDCCQRGNGMIEVDHAHQEVAEGIPLRRVVRQEDIVVFEGGD